MEQPAPSFLTSAPSIGIDDPRFCRHEGEAFEAWYERTAPAHDAETNWLNALDASHERRVDRVRRDERRRRHLTLATQFLFALPVIVEGLIWSGGMPAGRLMFFLYACLAPNIIGYAMTRSLHPIWGIGFPLHGGEGS